MTEYRSPYTLSRIAMTGVLFVGALESLAGVIGIVQIVDPSRMLDLGDEQLSLWLMIQSLIALVGFVGLVAAAVLFLIWLYRAYTNLPALRSEGTTYTPGWAVGCWFIPFANLVMPYQAVRNLWVESDPEAETDGGFLSSVQPAGPVFMKFWWGFWLLSNFASNASGYAFDQELKSSVAFSGYFFVITALLRLPAAILAVWVINSVTNRQEQRYAKFGPLTPSQPPPPPTFQ